MIWLSDEEIIEYSSFLVIIEDILETFPIKTVEVIFDILEQNLKLKSMVITLIKPKNIILSFSIIFSQISMTTIAS